MPHRRVLRGAARPDHRIGDDRARVAQPVPLSSAQLRCNPGAAAPVAAHLRHRACGRRDGSARAARADGTRLAGDDGALRASVPSGAVRRVRGGTGGAHTMSAAAATTIGYHEDLLGAYAEHCSALGLTRSSRDERLIAALGFLNRFPDLSAWMARPLPVRLADLDWAPLAWSLITFAAFIGKVRVDFDLLVAKHVGRSFGPAIVALFPDEVAALREAASRLQWAESWTAAVLGNSLPLVVATTGRSPRALTSLSDPLCTGGATSLGSAGLTAGPERSTDVHRDQRADVAAGAENDPDRRGTGSARELVTGPWLDELLARADESGLRLTGEGGFLPELIKAVLERGLAVELTDHLGYDKGDPAGRGSPNSRNGATPKTVASEVGPVGLAVPRDRASTFEPRLVPKGTRRLGGGLDDMIVSLYAGGMTVRDIQSHLARTIGTELSHDTISKITDGVLEEVKAWQARPLDPIYPIVYVDALMVKVRDGQAGSSGCAVPSLKRPFAGRGSAQRESLGATAAAAVSARRLAESQRQQRAADETTVRDLGDRRYAVVDWWKARRSIG